MHLPGMKALVLAVGMISMTSVSQAQAEEASLRITVIDGSVLMGGTEMDLDELRVALAKAGRQDEMVIFKVGPNAKSVFISRVLAVLKEAGYSRLTIAGPTADRPVVTVDPQKPL